MGTILKFVNIEIGTDPDAILNNGSLVLHDMNVVNLATAPTAQTKIPNQASAKASTIISGGTDVNLQSDYDVNLVGTTTTFGLSEITLKKGLHVIMSKQTSSVGRGVVLSFAQNIRDYIFANPTHDFYFSVWGNVTRLTDYAAGSNFYVGESATSYHSMLLGDSYIPTSSNLIGVSQNPSTPLQTGNFFRAIASNNYTGTFSGTAANKRSGVYWGSYSLTASGIPSDVFRTLNVGKASSFILYRVYLEDLTVSGRTYAQTLAIDQQLYSTAFGTGGKFSGDTFTNPSVMP